MKNGKNCFGITTNIINGGLECGFGSETYGSQHRADYYGHWLDLMGLPDENVSDLSCAGCGSMKSRFPDGGSGHTLSYFDQEWSGDAKCKLVSWQTGYSLYARDDYKRCICDKFATADPKGACPHIEKPDEPDDDDDNDDDDNDNDDDINPDDLSFGVQCTNPWDGKCGDNCDTGCFWSWPTTDGDGCMSQDAACRCKPEKADDFTYVKLCENECDSSCANCAFSWPKDDPEMFNSKEAKCRCSDNGIYWYPS